MSISVLLFAIEEYLTLKQQHVGHGNTPETLINAKKHVAIALNDYIDFRLEGLLEGKKRSLTSSQVQLGIEASDLERTAAVENVLDLIKALTTAPSPHWPSSAAEATSWMSEYEVWHKKTKELLEPGKERQTKTDPDPFLQDRYEVNGRYRVTKTDPSIPMFDRIDLGPTNKKDQ